MFQSESLWQIAKENQAEQLAWAHRERLARQAERFVPNPSDATSSFVRRLRERLGYLLIFVGQWLASRQKPIL
jgi:hypothetical protein